MYFYSVSWIEALHRYTIHANRKTHAGIRLHPEQVHDGGHVCWPCQTHKSFPRAWLSHMHTGFLPWWAGWFLLWIVGVISDPMLNFSGFACMIFCVNGCIHSIYPKPSCAYRLYEHAHDLRTYWAQADSVVICWLSCKSVPLDWSLWAFLVRLGWH